MKREKSQMMISVGEENTFDKTEYSIKIKKFSPN